MSVGVQLSQPLSGSRPLCALKDDLRAVQETERSRCLRGACEPVRQKELVGVCPAESTWLHTAVLGWLGLAL